MRHSSSVDASTRFYGKSFLAQQRHWWLVNRIWPTARGLREVGRPNRQSREYYFGSGTIKPERIYRNGPSFTFDPPVVIHDGEKRDIDWETEEMNVYGVDGKLRTTVKLRRKE